MGIFKGRNTTIKENQISSFSVSIAEYGATVPEILGTTRIPGNVIYYDDFTPHEHRESQRSGKGGKSKTTTVSYTYTVAAIIALCEGPVTGIGKIWKDKSIYNYPSEEVGLTLFKGTEDQQPWSYVVGKHPEKALSYAGLAYMAGVIDLGNSGSMPSYNFEVKGKLTDSDSVSAGKGDGIDVNPADYILYILNAVGLGDVEVEGIDNYRKYCREADLLISTPAEDTDSKAAREIINDIADITDSYIFWSNDHLKIVPRSDVAVGNWTPDKTVQYDLTPDDFILQSGGMCVSYSRKDSSELYNRVSVEFLNRANGYEKEIVNYEDVDDIKEFGVRQSSTKHAHYLYTTARAVKLAEALCRKNKYERVKYTFKLDWAFCRLEPGDLVTLTDPAIGLDKQPAMIDSVTEDEKGILIFTALSRAKGDYTAAVYNVHENERPYVDYNQEASDTDTPIILQPPAELTEDGLELWIGAKGKGDNWGGCEVYVSDNNTNYRYAGQITHTARIGKLTSAITAAATTINVSSNGEFISGTTQDAKRANTLCWLDGECLSYKTATLQSDGTWTLSGCIRGQYHTTAAAHALGSQFVRMDNTLLKIPFLQENVGKKIYLKFVSYNVFGSGSQSLADVQAYEYTLLAYYIPSVQNVTAYNRFRQLADGIARYDIVVKWDKPSLNSYLQADVWYKTNNTQELEGVKPIAGLKASEIGFAGNWIYGGSGESQVVIPQAVVGDTYLIAVCTKDKFGASVSPDAAPQTKITVAMKSTIPNVPDGFSIKFDKSAKVSWEEVTNTDIAWYEVRKDKSYGDEGDGLLARTTGLTATVQLTSRTGTLYLYARNALGKYSDPAVLAYNKSAPVAPAAPTLTSTLKGFNVLAKTSVPSGCIGMAVYISDSNSKITKVTTENNVYSHICGAGIYDVRIAWYDLFGEGNKSGSSRVTIKAQVDAELLADEAISKAKVDKAIQSALDNANSALSRLDGIDKTIVEMKQTDSSIQSTVAKNTSSISQNTSDIKSCVSQITQNANSITSIVTDVDKNTSDISKNTSDIKSCVSQITQNANSITAIVGNFGDAGKAKANYSAIAQMADDIALRVKADNIISQINLSKEGVQIAGKLIHITGDTLFDNNVITKGLIQAKAITSDKIDVSSLSAISAKIGTLQTATSGARVVIKDNLIQVFDSNNVLRVRMGVW